MRNVKERKRKGTEKWNRPLKNRDVKVLDAQMLGDIDIVIVCLLAMRCDGHAMACNGDAMWWSHVCCDTSSVDAGRAKMDFRKLLDIAWGFMVAVLHACMNDVTIHTIRS